MDRIERLERWWLIYKAKQALKIAAFFLAAVGAGAGAVYYASGGGAESGAIAGAEVGAGAAGEGADITPTKIAPSAGNPANIAESERQAAYVRQLRGLDDSREMGGRPQEQFNAPNTAIPPTTPTTQAGDWSGAAIAPIPPVISDNPPQTRPIVEDYPPLKPKMNIAPSFVFEGDLNRRVEKAASAALSVKMPASQLEKAASAALSAKTPASQTRPQNFVDAPTVYVTTQIPASEPQTQPAPQTPPPKQQAGAVVISRITSIADLEAAFNRQPSYSKAVDIAREYLKKNDAQAAYDWSMKANELNDRDERSWAIFAVSSYRLGNKERAVIALRAYLSERASEKLVKLLRQIETDEPNAGGDI